MPIRVYDKAAQQVVEVDGEEAARGFGEDRYAPVDKTLTFARGGETWTADSTDLGEMLGQGFELVDGEEANAIDLRREESDLGSTIQGAAERAAAGATFGLSSVALDALGADPERMAARAENLDWVGTGLEIGGALAATPFTGGASLEAGLARGLARAGAPRAAVRLLPGVGRNMVEGAAQGAGVAVDESVLGNRGLAADHLASSAMEGLLLGGGASLGLGAVAMGAKRASTKGLQSVMGRMDSTTGGLATREAAETIARAGENVEPGLFERGLVFQAEKFGGDVEAARRVGRLLDADGGAGDVVKVFRGMGKINADAAQTVGAGWREMDSAFQAVRKRVTGEAKAAEIDRMIPTEIQHTTARMLGDTLATARSHLDEMISTSGGKYGGPVYTPAMLQRMDEALQRAEFGAREAWQLSNSRAVGGAMHRVMDQLRRETGEILADNFGFAARPGLDATIASTNKGFRVIFDDVQSALQNPAIVGEKAALAQADVNSKWRGMFDAEAAFRNETSGIGRMLDPDHVTSDRDALKVVRQFGKMGADRSVATLDGVLESRLQWLDAVEKSYQLDDAARAEIARMRGAIGKLRGDFKRQAHFAGIADDLQSARAHEGNGSPSILAASPTDLLSMGAGYMAGGLAGAAIGRVASYVARPYATMKVLASVKSLIDKGDFGIAQSLGRFKRRIGGEKVGKSSRTMAGGLLASTTGVRMSRDERRKEALDRSLRIQQSPETLERMLAAPLYDLDRTAPGVAGEMRKTVQRASAFLASKAPPVYKPPMSGRPPLIAPSEAAKFERYLEAVVDPAGALDRLADGQVTAETAEVLREVYPALYEDVQDQITQILADAEAEGKEVPFDVRIALGLFYDTPTDQALEPGMLAAIQGAVNTPEIENAPITPSRPVSLNTKSRMTHMQRLEDFSA